MQCTSFFRALCKFRLNVNLHFIGFCSQCIMKMLTYTVGA